MIGNSLQIRQKVGQHEAMLDGALISLQAKHVMIAYLIAQIIYDLLQRLYHQRFFHPILKESAKGQAHHLGNRIDHYVNFPLSRVGKANPLFRKLLRGLGNVYRMIGYSFKISNHVKLFGDLSSFLLQNARRRKIDQIRSDHILILVNRRLQLFHLRNPLRLEIMQQGDGVKKDILALVKGGSKTVKFVDRTFNADRKRAREIFSFILSHYGEEIPKDTSFHFEIAGELLDEETLSLLEKAPEGAFRMEIGVQSFSEKTLSAIQRSAMLAP